MTTLGNCSSHCRKLSNWLATRDRRSRSDRLPYEFSDKISLCIGCSQGRIITLRILISFISSNAPGGSGCPKRVESQNQSARDEPEQ
jgi:hypothetical protein